MTASSHQESLAWLTLGLVASLREAEVHALVRQLGSATAAVEASRTDWIRVLGPDRGRCFQALGAARQEAGRQKDLARRQSASAVTPASATYPLLLKRLDYPPPMLFVQGELVANAVAVAVVGPRRASAYGLEVARMLGHQLALHGVTVVSGMAAGVDAAAHHGALDAGGPTVAVLGCGVDVPYPAGHRSLHHKIRDNGAVVSQFRMGTRPVRGSFPRRNQVISGICTGVVVVEAPARSGALITAASALRQGRDVFAVPGSILDGRNDGSNALLRDGAVVVSRVDDILDLQQGWSARAGLNTPTSGPVLANPAAEPAGALPRQVYEALDASPCSVDALAGVTALPVNQLLAILLELELGGHVRQWAGQRFTRTPVMR